MTITTRGLLLGLIGSGLALGCSSTAPAVRVPLTDAGLADTAGLGDRGAAVTDQGGLADAGLGPETAPGLTDAGLLAEAASLTDAGPDSEAAALQDTGLGPDGDSPLDTAPAVLDAGQAHDDVAPVPDAVSPVTDTAFPDDTGPPLTNDAGPDTGSALDSSPADTGADCTPVAYCPCAFISTSFACEWVGMHLCTAATTDTACENTAGCQYQLQPPPGCPPPVIATICGTTVITSGVASCDQQLCQHALAVVQQCAADTHLPCATTWTTATSGDAAITSLQWQRLNWCGF